MIQLIRCTPPREHLLALFFNVHLLELGCGTLDELFIVSWHAGRKEFESPWLHWNLTKWITPAGTKPSRKLC